MPTTGEEGEPSSTGATTDEPAPGEREPARVTLQVVDGDGEPLEGALVEFDGLPQPSGVAGLVDLAVGIEALDTRLVMRVSASGHTTSTAVFEGVASGAELLKVVVLHGLGEPVVLPAKQGGVAERDGVRVEVPPEAFVDAQGQPVKGEVGVTLVPLDPTQADAMTEMPGPLVAVRADESAAELEPVMMAEISAWQGGQRLQLAPGKTVRLTFAVPAGLQTSVIERQQIPAWWYDDVQGRWREEGNGKIEREDSELVWVVEVAHFTWWNSDRPWTEKNCYDVTVLGPYGDTVPNMQVTAKGLDYQGVSSAYTAGKGEACVEGKLGGKLTLQAGFTPNVLAAEVLQGDPMQPAACGGAKACIPVLLVLPDAQCYPGLKDSCYPGPNETEDVGICKGGATTQLGDCSWSPCSGAQVPLEESCLTVNVDEDCDGLLGMAEGCLCEPGVEIACWHPNPVILMKQQGEIGVCHGGEAICAEDGKSWGPCEGMVPPPDQQLSQESCDDNFDNDCSGAVNEGCACEGDAETPCYQGNQEDLDAPDGTCAEGTQKCIGGNWGPCENQVLPQVEQCLTPLDEDCDGDPGCCGDGVTNGGEECDDGNISNLDGCENDCVFSIVQVETGWYHSSVVLADGSLRSWGGENGAGGPGYGNYENIGDQWGEMPPPNVDVGGPVKQISIGAFGTTCALLDKGQIKCWGANNYGQLGYGDTFNRGGEDVPSSFPFVEVGGFVEKVSVGAFHVCVLIEGGLVKCWGDNPYGELGQGFTEVVGDNETPLLMPPVPLAAAAMDVQAGDHISCALLIGGDVQCWGNNNVGQLGYGHTQNIGDNEPVSGLVDVGEKVKAMAVGGAHVCVLLQSGTVRCWGYNDQGQLGAGNTLNIGDDEIPASTPTVAVGDDVIGLWAGYKVNYTLHPDGSMRCWGYCFGQEVMPNVGDEPGEMPPGKLILKSPIRRFNIGRMSHHACALDVDGELYCWGHGPSGAFGYPYAESLGDAPGEMPPEIMTDVL